MKRFTDTERRIQESIKYQMQSHITINQLWQTAFVCGADDAFIRTAIFQTFGDYHEHKCKDGISIVYQVPQFIKGKPEIHVAPNEFQLPGIGCTEAALVGDQIIAAVRKAMLIREPNTLTVQTAKPKRRGMSCA